MAYSKKFQARLERVRRERDRREAAIQRKMEQEAKQAEIQQACDETLKELDSAALWSSEEFDRFEARARIRADEVRGTKTLGLAGFIGGFNA